MHSVAEAGGWSRAWIVSSAMSMYFLVDTLGGNMSETVYHLPDPMVDEERCVLRGGGQNPERAPFRLPGLDCPFYDGYAYG